MATKEQRMVRVQWSVYQPAKAWTVRGSNPSGSYRYSVPSRLAPRPHPASWTMDTVSWSGLKWPKHCAVLLTLRLWMGRSNKNHHFSVPAHACHGVTFALTFTFTRRKTRRTVLGQGQSFSKEATKQTDLELGMKETCYHTLSAISLATWNDCHRKMMVAAATKVWCLKYKRCSLNYWTICNFLNL
jgi:hypothetical protein